MPFINVPPTPLEEAIAMLQDAKTYLLPREKESGVAQLLDHIEDFIQENEIVDTNNPPF